jgi:glycine/D-amino acid oxidase-like deaminating enzyme
MQPHFHTVVIGGGCLGTAAAVAIRRRLQQRGIDADVAVIEKLVIGSGVTARHSGIVRAANADPAASVLATHATHMWRNLDAYWGVPIDVEAAGALWIAKANASGDNPKWQALQADMETSGVAFERVSLPHARQLCPPIVKLSETEVFYHEPGAIQIDPVDVRAALYKALEVNGVVVREKTTVTGFQRGGDGRVTGVFTNTGVITCDHVVNACGPWSPAVFASLGLQIPVSTEAVSVVNWITSRQELSAGMPIIADYVNLAYFRMWRGGEIHMHQPRKRGVRETARVFAENPITVMGADFVNDPTNQALGYSQIKLYEDIARRRFNNVDQTVYGSGYRSYFDITPDLKFILGPDPRVENVIHCLGAGQSFKYAPVFGEVMADFVTGDTAYANLVRGFSIARFDQSYMQAFWNQVAGNDNSLAVEAAGL